ncbi:hypothetical protein NESM_000179100 [Novymonas esmeraldas]|uniref:Uncharacterized protein n=1 Tax=Novymonas esmeraldas TaxID=1808958 RepID=A0AAW0F820_9TRYP
MSSLQDSAGAAGSHHDSIPLDGQDSSISMYSEDEGEEGEYDRSSQRSDDAASSLDYSSVSRTYLSHSRTSGVRAHSEDYTGTASYYSNGGAASNSNAYDDDYSSGYGSLTYGDSALRSPQSELSSTFASLYYENKYMVNTRATMHFLRRPLYYLAFATAGSGAVGSVCRLATTVARRFIDPSLAVVPGSAALHGGGGVSPGLPSGYPNVPQWLCEVRAALPSVVEVPAAWVLRRHGVPVLSDVMERQQLAVAAATTTATTATTVAAQVGSGVQEVWRTWQRTGPAIPVALFLPIFSIVVFKVAQHVRPSQTDLSELLRARQAGDDADVASVYPSTPTPTRPSLILDASPIEPLSTSAGNMSAQSGAADMPLTSRGTVSASVSRLSAVAAGDGVQGRPDQAPAAALVPPVNLAAAGAADASRSSPDGVDAGDVRSRSRSTTLAPLTHRHVADAAATTPSVDGDAVEGQDADEVVDVDVDVDVDVNAARLSPLSPPPPLAEVDYDPAAKPPGPATSSSSASPSVSPPPRMPQQQQQQRADGSAVGRLLSVKDSTLRGDVVAAVAGVADVGEANVAFTAAVRYGCSAVVLPSALRGARGLLEPPPSLTVEFADDVVAAVAVLAGRRGLTMVGVTAQQWDAQAVSLDTFVHPANAVYVFTAREAASAAAVEAVGAAVRHRVFVGTSRTEVPVNQVFYDRLLKERPTPQ